MRVEDLFEDVINDHYKRHEFWEKRLSPRRATKLSLVPHSLRTNLKPLLFGVTSQLLRRACERPILGAALSGRHLSSSDSIKSNLQGYNPTSLAQAGSTFTPTDGLWQKSTVYGLNGHRAIFVIALCVITCEHAI
jgi:hypothetical protein